MGLFTALGKTGKVARRSLGSFLLGSLVSIAFSLNCFAGTITLQWDADAIPNLAGYHVTG